MATSRNASSAAAAGPLLRPDDVTRAGVAAANAAGQAAVREALAVVLGDETGAPVGAAARAAAAARCAAAGAAATGGGGGGGDDASSSAAAAAAAFGAVCALLERALRRLAALGADEAEGAAALAALGLEAPLAADVAGAARRGRAALLAAAEAAAPRGPGVASVRWRVDVIISSGALGKVMRPAVLMELTLTDGARETFDVPLESFHALRFSCAKVLSEMASVEGSPILRIA